MCGPCTGTNKTLLQKVKNLFTNTTHRRPGDITDSPYFKELNDAYLFAYQASITTMPTIQKAKLDGTLLRSHLAKMLVQYAVGILDKKANTNAVCSFIDIKDQSPEMQYYAITACQLGLMGIDCDGTPTQRFNPNDEVTRAQFGAVLSRLLYGQKHSSATDTPRYTDYLSSLHEAGIMKDISQPERKELRGYVMLMLMRAMK